jgi:putative ABC transport system substrate-binding protein
MKRRDALRALFATVLVPPGAWPFEAYGQARVRRIVSITGNAEVTVEEPFYAFREKMKSLGYEEGRDTIWETGYGEFSRERTARLAAEAMASKPDLIFAQHAAVNVFAALTNTIPIVVIYSGDLVEAGIVKSLAHPGANITGMQLMNNELVGKRIEVLKEIAPSVQRLAILAMPGHPGLHSERDASMKAAERLGLSAAFYPVTNMQEVDAALAAARVAGADALVLFPDPITLASRERIAAFALQHKMPLVSGWDNYALAGGLVTYGLNLIEAWRRTAFYVDRILKGAKPSDLPIEQPTIFELVVNRKTATALGIDIPQSILLLQANRVIE